jgi:hypothetical protein
VERCWAVARYRGRGGVCKRGSTTVENANPVVFVSVLLTNSTNVALSYH